MATFTTGFGGRLFRINEEARTVEEFDGNKWVFFTNDAAAAEQLGGDFDNPRPETGSTGPTPTDPRQPGVPPTGPTTATPESPANQEPVIQTSGVSDPEGPGPGAVTGVGLPDDTGDDGRLLFAVTITNPNVTAGLGRIIVGAVNAEQAVISAQRYLNTIPTLKTDSQLSATQVDDPASINPDDDLIIDIQGNVVGTRQKLFGIDPNAQVPPGSNNPSIPPGGVADPANTAGDLNPTPESVSLEGAFRNFLRDDLGVSGPGLGVAQRRRQSAFDAFSLDQLLALAGPQSGAGGEDLSSRDVFNATRGGENVGGFINFLRQGGSTPQVALDALLDLATRPPTSAGLDDNGTPSTVLGLLQGAAPGDNTGVGGVIGNTALEALLTRLPQSVASRFGGLLVNQAGDNFQDLIASAAGSGGTTPQLATFLLDSLGLRPQGR